MTSQEALSLLRVAIRKVQPCYIRIDAVPTEQIKLVQVERSFAYELYHQWSVELEEYKKTHIEYNSLRLNGEISKNFDSQTRVFPDMILHGGQECIDRQILVCEIKRADANYPAEKDIIEDLHKLSKFLHLTITNNETTIDAHYSDAVFIFANIGRARMIEKINNAMNKYPEIASEILPDAENIHCVSVEVTNQDCVDVSYLSLNDI